MKMRTSPFPLQLDAIFPSEYLRTHIIRLARDFSAFLEYDSKMVKDLFLNMSIAFCGYYMFSKS